MSWTHTLEYFRDSNRKWRSRIVARNGEIIWSSEAYANITMCRKSATNVIDAAQKKTLRIITTKS